MGVNEKLFKIFEEINENKVGNFFGDSIINVSNTAKQMIAIKTSQKILYSSERTHF